jgi:hypothetical protein
VSPRRLALGAALLLIGAATLIPAGYGVATAPASCLICGAQGSADAVSNIILFLPLGLALAALGTRTAAAVAICLALAISIETIQLFISRHSALGDMVWNATGGALGVMAYRIWPHLRPRAGSGAFPGLVATAAVLGSAALSAWLLQPAQPAGGWIVHWTPRWESMEEYRGRLLGAEIDGRQLVRWRMSGVEPLKAALAAGRPVALEIEAGPRPRRLAPLISIMTDHEAEVLLIGTSGTDLVLRDYRRASALRFDAPASRVRGALAAVAPGDTARIVVRGTGRGRCVEVRGGAPQCGADVGISRAWAVLLSLARGPAKLEVLLDAAWMIGLLFPVGLWSGRALLLNAAVAAGGALFAIPWAAGLAGGGWAAWLAAAAGAAGGAGARVLLARRSGATRPSP